MRLSALSRLIRRDLSRTRGPLSTAGFGIAVGTAALVFFLALGLGARRTLLSDVFPIDQVELEPKKTSVGLLSLLGVPHEPDGIDETTARSLAALPGVKAAYPKLKLRFPSMAKGGKETLGHEIGTHEMLGDGVDPALVDGPLARAFVDPLTRPGRPCDDDGQCDAAQYCERPSGADAGRCSDPVPALVSHYLVEIFDHAIAPSHGLPPVAELLLSRSSGVPFEMTLGTSLLGVAAQGTVRRVKIRVIGVSPRAIDVGVTLPLDVVRRWNREYAGEAAASRYSSVVVRVARASDAGRAIEGASKLGLLPHDTRARDVSVLVSTVLALLVLVASVILLVAALNIAHTFRSLIGERRREIGLYRALGASAADVRRWMLGLALAVGAGAGLCGAVVARLLALLADWRAATDLPDFPFKPQSFFEFSPGLYALAVAFAALFAVLGAFGPARRAARTDPAAALSGSA